MLLKARLRQVLRTKPRRFQAQGIALLERAGGRAILGDDMGLGKTLQVLGYLALHPEARPAVIVCPSNAKYEWEDQIRNHTRRLECTVLSGRTPYKADTDIVIINYDIVSYWEKHLLALRPKALVMDECHYVKNRRIKRTTICKKLSKGCAVIIPMSGTPIINRPSEFFPVLNMLFPREFSSFWKYAFRYCDPKKGFKGYGWDFNGATNTQELHERVAPFMIRRMKSEVLTELPPKQRIPIPVDLDNWATYVSARDEFLLWYAAEYGEKESKKAEKAPALVRIGKLRQIAAQGKLAAAIRWIDDYLEGTNQKLVVFCYHQVVFRALAAHYGAKAALGGKGGEKRQLEVKRFQGNPKCRLFIGSIKADKEAITLTAANAVLFVEMGWTPGEHDQAEDRINRIGQTADSITAYYVLARNSIDEYIWDLIEKKRKVIAQILDGEEAAEALEKHVSLNHLIRDLYNKKETNTWKTARPK